MTHWADKTQKMTNIFEKLEKFLKLIINLYVFSERLLGRRADGAGLRGCGATGLGEAARWVGSGGNGGCVFNL